VSARGAETKARSLDAARELLVRGGAANLTMRGVAAQAGIALGNLQYHFATLELLLEALLTRELEAGQERIRSSFAAGTAASRALPLAKIVDVLLGDHDDDALVRLFIGFWSLAAINPSLRPRLRAFYDGWARLVAQALVARSVAPKKALRRARLFLACLEGLSLFRSGVAGHPDDPPRKEARELLLRVLEDR
jgi:AcrR family transcriptional regulator